MKTVFFAARKIHKEYFSKISALISDSSVIYYKTCLIPAVTSIPLDQLKQIVNQLIKEKQNHPKHKHKGSSYWKQFSIIKLIESCWIFLLYYRALHRTNASKLVIWNGLKYRQLIAIEAANKLNLQIIYMENGLLPGYTTLDFKGINYSNSVPRNPEFFLTYESKSVTELTSYIVPTTDRKTEAPLPEHFIFIPFQVNTDSQITRFSPWIQNMFQLVRLIEAVTNTLGEASPYFIFKLHPACPEDYSELLTEFKDHSRIQFQTDSSLTTPELITKADAVITINSTVGIESLLLKKKVIVLGRAFYNIPGLTLSADSQEKLIHSLTTLSEWEADTTLRDKFFNYLATEYQIPGRWQDSSETHLKLVADLIKKGHRNMARHVFLASTPFNMLTASMVAFDLPSHEQKSLFLIDQPELDSSFVKTVQNWKDSPFSSTQVLTRKASKISKRKQRHQDFKRIDMLLQDISPTHIYTGNDRRIEFQYAMAHTAGSPKGIYIDDGTYTYLGRKTHWLKDHFLDNWAKKLAYGMWWKQPATIGASEWIDQCYIAFPNEVTPLLRYKDLHKLPKNLNRQEFHSLAERAMIKHSSLKQLLNKISSLLILPHESVLDEKLNILLNQIILSDQGLTAYKHHPRTSEKDFFSPSENSIELPAELPMEVLLPLLSSDCFIYGDLSTALLTAKWLRPELRVTAYCKKGVSKEWATLLEKISINIRLQD